MSKKKEPAEVRFIKIAEVKRITSLSTSEIYRRLAAGQFPKQVRLGQKSVAWVEREVRAWVDVMLCGRDDPLTID